MAGLPATDFTRSSRSCTMVEALAVASSGSFGYRDRWLPNASAASVPQGDEPRTMRAMRSRSIAFQGLLSRLEGDDNLGGYRVEFRCEGHGTANEMLTGVKAFLDEATRFDQDIPVIWFTKAEYIALCRAAVDAFNLLIVGDNALPVQRDSPVAVAYRAATKAFGFQAQHARDPNGPPRPAVRRVFENAADRRLEYPEPALGPPAPVVPAAPAVAPAAPAVAPQPVAAPVAAAAPRMPQPDVDTSLFSPGERLVFESGRVWFGRWGRGAAGWWFRRAPRGGRGSAFLFKRDDARALCRHAFMQMLAKGVEDPNAL